MRVKFKADMHNTQTHPIYLAGWVGYPQVRQICLSYRHNYISTLFALRPNPILSVREKLTYYFLDHLGWKWDIRNTNTQLIVKARAQFLKLVGQYDTN